MAMGAAGAGGGGWCLAGCLAPTGVPQGRCSARMACTARVAAQLVFALGMPLDP